MLYIFCRTAYTSILIEVFRLHRIQKVLLFLNLYDHNMGKFYLYQENHQRNH